MKNRPSHTTITHLYYTCALTALLALTVPYPTDAFTASSPAVAGFVTSGSHHHHPIERYHPFRPSPVSSPSSSLHRTTRQHNTASHDNEHTNPPAQSTTRRSLLLSPLLAPLLLTPPPANALGTLPELSATNFILQGLTVTVADRSQLDATAEFFVSAFSAEILRQRTVGSVSEVWLGFGPEMLDVPEGFEVPVSSWAMNGGHVSLRVRYDEKGTEVFYRKGEEAPGNNVAYLQLAVPAYRISQMIATGGNVLDAFGIVNVVSPCGFPVRGIIGIAPDPIMFVALNCVDVGESKAFYEALGFVETEYPYSRPKKGQGEFEPPQPEGSVYLSPTPNGMGILLLPIDPVGGNKFFGLGGKKKKTPLRPNPVLSSLDIVYAPSGSGGAASDVSAVVDPSMVGITFTPEDVFTKEERKTRVGSGEQKKGLPFNTLN